MSAKIKSEINALSSYNSSHLVPLVNYSYMYISGIYFERKIYNFQPLKNPCFIDSIVDKYVKHHSEVTISKGAKSKDLCWIKKSKLK
jgi:hypothetical protein